jgi:hypothetical protein
MKTYGAHNLRYFYLLSLFSPDLVVENYFRGNVYRHAIHPDTHEQEGSFLPIMCGDGGWWSLLFRRVYSTKALGAVTIAIALSS